MTQEQKDKAGSSSSMPSGLLGTIKLPPRHAGGAVAAKLPGPQYENKPRPLKRNDSTPLPDIPRGGGDRSNLSSARGGRDEEQKRL